MRVLIFSGDVGGRNVGDVAITCNVVRKVRLRWPAAEIVCLSSETEGRRHGVEAADDLLTYFERPAPTWLILLRRHTARKLMYAVRSGVLLAAATMNKSGLPFICTREFSRLAALFENADLLIIAGGGYLNHLWPHLLFEAWTLARLADRFGIPVMVSGQGIGPLKRSWQRRIMREIFDIAAVSYTRDPYSRDDLVELGVSSDKAVNLGDDAVDLPCGSIDAPLNCTTETIRDYETPFIAGHFRNTNWCSSSVYYVEYMARLMDQVVRQTGCRVILFPFHKGSTDDTAANFEVFRRMEEKGKVEMLFRIYDPQVMKALLSRAVLGIGMGLHFSTFLLSAGVACVPLYHTEYYRRKLRGLCAQFNIEDQAVNTAQTTVSTTVALVDKIWHARNELRKKLEARTAEMYGGLSQAWDRLPVERTSAFARQADFCGGASTDVAF